MVKIKINLKKFFKNIMRSHNPIFLRTDLLFLVGRTIIKIDGKDWTIKEFLKEFKLKTAFFKTSWGLSILYFCARIFFLLCGDTSRSRKILKCAEKLKFWLEFFMMAECQIFWSNVTVISRCSFILYCGVEYPFQILIHGHMNTTPVSPITITEKYTSLRHPPPSKWKKSFADFFFRKKRKRGNCIFSLFLCF